jgi:hypothetical protein
MLIRSELREDITELINWGGGGSTVTTGGELEKRIIGSHVKNAVSL